MVDRRLVDAWKLERNDDKREQRYFHGVPEIGYVIMTHLVPPNVPNDPSKLFVSFNDANEKKDWLWLLFIPVCNDFTVEIM